VKDRYSSFEELKAAEHYGHGYKIDCIPRGSIVAVIAPHGGCIEPGTSEIAAAIADNKFNLYSFQGLKQWPHCRLHITSTRFDEPQCMRLIERCAMIIAVHGLKGTDSRVDIGGLDVGLRDAVCQTLCDAGFTARTAPSDSHHAAVSRSNVCNKGSGGAGIQLEITKGLRDGLRGDNGRMALFAQAVRKAIDGDPRM
jgi:phage replication-related protein YjqB (UPF0714/DUF867 family)